MRNAEAGPVELLFLRHAHAGDASTWEGDDDLRPLTEKGQRQAERVGRLLVAAGCAPDVVLTSPLARASQTAEIVADLLGLQPRQERRLGEGVDLRVLDAILGDAGDPERPLLVGHDPDFSEVVTLLSGTGIFVRKATLVRVDAERPLVPGGGELRWLVPPDLLRG